MQNKKPRMRKYITVARNGKTKAPDIHARKKKKKKKRTKKKKKKNPSNSAAIRFKLSRVSMEGVCRGPRSKLKNEGSHTWGL